MNQETRDLYSVTGTIYSSGITNAELEQRENSRSREDLPRWHSDLRQKIAAELASFTEEDSRGVTSAAPRVALTQTPQGRHVDNINMGRYAPLERARRVADRRLAKRHP